MEENRRTDLAFKVLDNVQNLIKFADTKINVLLVISGVTTTFVLTNFQGLYSQGIIPKTCLGLFFIAFLVFVILSVLTISPRSDKHSRESLPKTIYFGHIAKRVEAKDFIDDYLKLDEKTFMNDLLYQIFENSKIADKKFEFYKKSLIALNFQILLFFVLLTIKMI
jgi:hypothetical protein